MRHACLLVLILAACGDNNTIDGDPLIGTWERVRLGGELGPPAAHFRADGRALLRLWSEVVVATWARVDAGSIQICPPANECYVRSLRIVEDERTMTDALLYLDEGRPPSLLPSLAERTTAVDDGFAGSTWTFPPVPVAIDRRPTPGECHQPVPDLPECGCQCSGTAHLTLSLYADHTLRVEELGDCAKCWRPETGTWAETPAGFEYSREGSPNQGSFIRVNDVINRDVYQRVQLP